MESTASTLGTRWTVPGVITGASVLAAVTSLPNAVAAVFLARRGRAAATLSEAFNSNTLNVLAGLLIPAVIIASPGLGGALRTAIWYYVITVATIALALAGRGINRRSGTLIIAAYLVFAITLIVKALPPGTQQSCADLACSASLQRLHEAVSRAGPGAPRLTQSHVEAPAQCHG